MSGGQTVGLGSSFVVVVSIGGRGADRSVQGAVPAVCGEEWHWAGGAAGYGIALMQTAGLKWQGVSCQYCLHCKRCSCRGEPSG